MDIITNFSGEDEMADMSVLETFADKNGLDIVVNIRQHEPIGSRMRYYANFKPDADIKEGIALISSFGNGNTKELAIKNFADTISGKILVFEAMNANRFEVFAPNFTAIYRKVKES